MSSSIVSPLSRNAHPGGSPMTRIDSAGPEPPASCRLAPRPSSPEAVPGPGPDAIPPSAKKPFLRRTPDPSSVTRPYLQLAFLLLNVWIGIQFYAWVRHYETAGASIKVSRPPGVEGWLPIASLMNLKYLVETGRVPEVHAAGLFLLLAFVGMSFAVRKSFCSWLCPVGTLSEWLWQGGQAMFGRTLRLPRWIDVPLRGAKYVLLGLFLAAVGSMSADALRAFLTSPYGMVADVKMLDFFRRMGTTTATVTFVLVAASVVVKNAWCRYFCPYGALLGLVGLVSPSRIRRNADLCIDCGKCAVACPSLLPVDRLRSVRSAECTSCLSCVAACPVQDALDLTWASRPVPRAWIVAAVVAVVFVGLVGYARLAGHWHTIVPDEVLFQLIPRASEFGHP
jgi:polyferredoxin